jgi:hypothetical protein
MANYSFADSSILLMSLPQRGLVLYMRLLRQVVYAQHPSAWRASMVLFDVRPRPASTVRGDAGTDPLGGAMYKTQVLPATKGRALTLVGPHPLHFLATATRARFGPIV